MTDLVETRGKSLKLPKWILEKACENSCERRNIKPKKHTGRKLMTIIAQKTINLQIKICAEPKSKTKAPKVTDFSWLLPTQAIK